MLSTIIIGSILLLACWLMLKHFSRAIRCEFQKDIERLSATVRTLEESSAGRSSESLASPNTEKTALEVVASKPVETVGTQPVPDRESTTISREAEAAIAATISACIGQKVQIRSVRLLQNPGETRWMMQGRKAVQSSHNLRARPD